MNQTTKTSRPCGGNGAALPLAWCLLLAGAPFASAATSASAATAAAPTAGAVTPAAAVAPARAPGSAAPAANAGVNSIASFNAGAVPGGVGNPAAPAAAGAAGKGAGTPALELRNPITESAKGKSKRAALKTVEPYTPIGEQGDLTPVPEIEMYVGESRVFPTPGVARIAVGNGQILNASALDDKEVIVFANGIGVSSLFVWHEDGRYQRIKVNIVPGERSRITREVASFLQHIPKTTATVVGDKVIVEGDELSDGDREKIAELAKRYPQIVNFTSPIGWEQTVLMDVKVVEFPKNELRELGLKWNPTGGGAIGAIWMPGGRGDVNGVDMGGRQIAITAPAGRLPPIGPIDTTKGNGVGLPSNLTILSAVNMGLNAQLNALEQNGSASILAEPQLSTRSGYKASFLAGGEFPYSVTNLNGVTIVFKSYGIKLEIEPRVGRNGVIRAEIDSEVSSLDTSVPSVAGPALLTRRTKTEFNVRTGETIVLSGLLQRSSSNDIDKVPLLGDLPVLGALFRSKRFQNKETELVVFVTPTVVDPRSPGLVERVERAGQRLGEKMGRSPYLSEPLQPGSDAGKVFAPSAPAAATATTPAAPDRQ
ncbi:type II and III secretion system protein family protein [Rugamonas sp. CCM 8940]|uniref:type II and III secretion system protein family protein n=1 Tax=Rugamonas sp. CCM 8940 TaxID=2765359 RepID=UPI001F1B13A3|nr:pilus assembly protein N-terminal domain-containing protein [Rugamonas sp. CCM 8940]